MAQPALQMAQPAFNENKNNINKVMKHLTEPGPEPKPYYDNNYYSNTESNFEKNEEPDYHILKRINNTIINKKLNMKIKKLEEQIKVLNKRVNKLFEFMNDKYNNNCVGKNIHDILLFIIFGIFIILLIEVMFNIFKMKFKNL